MARREVLLPGGKPFLERPFLGTPSSLVRAPAPRGLLLVAGGIVMVASVVAVVVTCAVVLRVG
jgi:hypothetical protein